MDTFTGRLATMRFERQCCVAAVLAFVVVLTTKTNANPSEHHVTGIVDQSVTLPCVAHHSGGQLRDVTWSDLVYNTDESEQSIIFRSENNPSRHISKSHTNALNYKVDAEFRLTIMNLNQDSDVGKYICTSTSSNGMKHERQYILSVMSKPECEVTAKKVEPGETTQLSCQMSYGAVNAQPSINWYRGEKMIDSVDEFDVGLAKKSVQVTATIDDDRRPFYCVTQLGDVTNRCNVTLIVPHSVQQAQFVGGKGFYKAGEELRCTAKSSPLPRITLTPKVMPDDSGASSSNGQTPELREQSGEGWRSIRIPDEWVRKRVMVRCTASNVVNGRESTVTTDIVFNVTEAPRPAGNRGVSVQFCASPILMSLWSLLLATWPAVVARIVC